MRESSGTPIRHGADATLQNVLRQSPSVRYGNTGAPSIIHLLNSVLPAFESEFLMSASPEDPPRMDRNCLICIPHSDCVVFVPWSQLPSAVEESSLSLLCFISDLAAKITASLLRQRFHRIQGGCDNRIQLRWSLTCLEKLMVKNTGVAEYPNQDAAACAWAGKKVGGKKKMMWSCPSTGTGQKLGNGNLSKRQMAPWGLNEFD